MKKTLFLFLFLAGVVGMADAQKKSDKRGISYDIPYVQDLTLMSPGVSWFYNWGITPKSSVTNYLEQNQFDFVPMAWNGGYNKTALRQYLETHPETKYILGFNEPNFKSQARMTPSEAAAKWPELEAIADEFNLKIVSPAVNFCSTDGAVSENGTTYTDPVKYLDDFFAACPDCRVDYVAIHCYMNDPGAVSWYVGLFKKYEKPIWLTEFCSWEGGVTREQQLNSMVRKIEMLETDDQVFRYAWFIGRTAQENTYPYMQLLPGGDKGELTDLGNIFVHMSPFDSTRYYSVNEQIPAEYYMASSGISLAETTDQEGILDVTTPGNGDWMEYLVDVKSAGVYNLNLRMASAKDQGVKVYSGATLCASEELPATGSLSTWKTQYIPVNLPAGKQRIQLKMTGSASRANWIQLTNTAGIDPLDAERLFTIYPNPVVSTLQVNTDKEVRQLTVYDISGRLMVQETRTKVLELSFLPSGTYLLTVTFEDGSQAKTKFVK